MALSPARAGRSPAALVLLAALAVAGCRDGGEAVRIGVVGPINAPNGASMKLAVEMAAEELNADLSRTGGRRIELVLLDDRANADTGMARAAALRADPSVVAVIGHLNSGVSLRAATIYGAAEGERAGTPVAMISPASSAPALTRAGDWIFRVTPTDLEFAPALARMAAGSLGRRRAAVLYVNDDYGRGVMSSFGEAFRAQGGAVVSADPFVPAVLDEPGGIDAYLVRALARGADALVIGAQAEEGIEIIRAARRLGFTGPILGSDGLTNVKTAGPVAEGVYVASSFLPDRPDSTAQAFVRRYRERHGGRLPDHRGAMAYDVMYLLADALREVGPDRRRIRDHVAAVGAGGAATGHPGVSGVIRFDENGDVVEKPVSVGVVRSGELVTAAAQ